MAAADATRGDGRSLSDAAELVERAGVVLVFPDKVVLPSLWEAVVGEPEIEVFMFDERGRRVFTPEIQKVWSLKDRLAKERRVCLGKHVRRRLALVSLQLIPSLYALTGRPGRPDDFREPGLLSPLELELAEGLLEGGPRTGPELRALLGLRDAKRTKRALEALQQLLVVTQAGEVEQDHGWAAAVFDLLPRRYAAELRKLPSLDAARAEIAAIALRCGSRVAAADVAAAFRLSRSEAADTLDRLVDEERAWPLPAEGRVRLWRLPESSHRVVNRAAPRGGSAPR